MRRDHSSDDHLHPQDAEKEDVPPRRHGAKQTLVEPSHETDAVAHAVLGAAIEVHRHLGPGYLESVYEHALAIELELRRIPCERQVTTGIVYKGILVAEHRIDLIVDGLVLVELKAVESIAPIHIAQVLAYLKATNLELGLLLNFRAPTLKEGMRRVIRSP